MRRNSIIGNGFAALVLLALLCSGTAMASAAEPAPTVGFRLAASDGYTIHGLAFDGTPAGKPDELILFAHRKGASVGYFFRRGVSVGEGAISADLGPLGSVDLRFQPDGRSETETSSCSRHPVEVESGAFVGHFDFTGEEGFTEAHSTSVRGDDRFVLDLLCASGIDEGVGGHAPGAMLKAHWRGIAITARKNSPTRPSRFTASIQEKIGAVGVEREVSVRSSASAFDFDVPDQSALLSPPAPFGGTARFFRRGAGSGRLVGNLEVDFPGRRDVSLAGARGSLQRWVANPSHPFRPL